MNKFSLNQFNGGVQEGYGVTDFQNNQWAVLKGIVPYNEISYESQWPAHQIGQDYSLWLEDGITPNSYVNDTAGNPNIVYKLNAVFPLVSQVGTFLVVIREDGTLWWALAPESSDDYTVSANTIWHNIKYTTNVGYNIKDSVQPSIMKIAKNPDYRFVCGVPFDTYKFVKTPDADMPSDFSFDYTPSTGYAQTICSGVLISARRRNVNGTIDFINNPSHNSDPYDEQTHPETYRSVIAYVDPSDSTVKLASFPNLRRWPWYLNDPNNYNLGSTKISPWATDSGRNSITPTNTFESFPFINQYPFEQDSKTATINYVYVQSNRGGMFTITGTNPFVQGDIVLLSGTGTVYDTPSGGYLTITSVGSNTATFTAPSYMPVTSAVPGLAVSGTLASKIGSTGYPREYNWNHPYTYWDKDKTLLPGTGFMPRANIGTLWGSTLILGDIEWNSDGASQASQQNMMAPTANAAPMGNIYNVPLLRDSNTTPHRGHFYFSTGQDIDVFDPTAVLRISGTDTRIAGMYNINNALVSITTAGGPNDGVSAWTGNLSQLIPYDQNTQSNPNAILRRIIRGGVGPADYNENDTTIFGHVNQTSLWADAGIVTFVDRLGGIFYTEGTTCDRMDYTGFRVPQLSTFRDHTAAAGRHLLVWRDKRLLCFTLTNSAASVGTGCWTEIIVPQSIDDAGDLRSMVGGTKDFYFILNGNVWRFAIEGQRAERGAAFFSDTSNTEYQAWLPIEIATATKGSNILGYGNTLINTDDQTKINWHRAGVSFHTQTGCLLLDGTIKGGPALDDRTLLSNGKYNFPMYALDIYKSYEIGTHTYEMPAGIGSSYEVSSSWRFYGDVKLEGVILWSTGATMKRGDANE